MEEKRPDCITRATLAPARTPEFADHRGLAEPAICLTVEASHRPHVVAPMRIPFILAVLALLPAGPAAADGEESYQTRCALCHGGDGAGSDRAASILAVLHASGPGRLARIITGGVPDRGMPRFELPEAELTNLVAYLKEMAAAAAPAARDPRAPRPRAGTLALADGRSLDGTILNESGFDAQLRTPDGRLRLLRREGDAYREPAIAPAVDWPSYHGSDSGNRHSPLDQIHRGNVGSLAAEWFHPIPDVPMLEGTPVVIAGVMYVTAVNQVRGPRRRHGRAALALPGEPGLEGVADGLHGRRPAVRRHRLGLGFWSFALPE